MPTDTTPLLQRTQPPPRAGAGLGFLLVAHTLEYYTSRTWEFAWPIWLAQLVPDSLAPLSAYGIAICLGAMLLGGKIGTLLDRPSMTRWTAVREAVVSAKVAMILACSILLVWFETVQQQDGPIAKLILPYLPADDLSRTAVLMIPLVCAGLLIKLSNTAYVISVERDWVVVINHGDPARLAWTNGWIRRIDLLCKLIAPLVIASLIAAFPARVTVTGLGSFAALDMLLELVLFNRVREYHPALSLPKSSAEAHEGLEHHNEVAAEFEHEYADHGATEPLLPTTKPTVTADEVETAAQSESENVESTTLADVPSTQNYRSPIVRYWHHPVFVASLSMASLYVTVLSFGGQMIQYLASETRISAQAIAGYRAFSSLAGVIATWVAPALITRYGPIRVGLWSIWSQTASLAPIAIVLLISLIGSGWSVDPNTPELATLLCVCVAISRVFLWSFDMAHMQVMQESIDSHEVGAINGVHYAACATGDLMTYVLTLVWWSPSSFPIPMLISMGCVLNGACLWTVHTYRVRHHLIHWDRLPFNWRGLLRYSHPN